MTSKGMSVCCPGGHWDYWISQQCSVCGQSWSINTPANFLREAWEGWQAMEASEVEQERDSDEDQPSGDH